MTLGYTRSGMLLELKVTGSINEFCSTRTAIHRHSLGGVTSRRREIELNLSSSQGR